MPFFVTIYTLIALLFQPSSLQWSSASFTPSEIHSLSQILVTENSSSQTGISSTNTANGKKSDRPAKPNQASIVSVPSPTPSPTEALKNQTGAKSVPTTPEQSKLEDIQKYNSDLMNTVFFSLLGSVITVTTVMLGFKVLVDVIDRENQKKSIVEEAKSDLLDWMDRRVSTLTTRIQWLEYQISSLSAVQLEQKQGLEGFCSIQDRLRAIEALLQPNNNYQEESVSRCIDAELKAIRKTLEKLIRDQQAQPNLYHRVPELIEFNKYLREKALYTLEKQLENIDLTKLNVDKDHIENIKHSLLAIKL